MFKRDYKITLPKTQLHVLSITVPRIKLHVLYHIEPPHYKNLSLPYGCRQNSRLFEIILNFTFISSFLYALQNKMTTKGSKVQLV